MKNYILSLLGAALLTISTAVNAQIAGGAGGGGAAVPNCPPKFPVPDFSMLSNHASLVSWALKKVQGVQVTVDAGSVVLNNYTPNHFYVLTNNVKTLRTITAQISNDWWYLPVTSPTNWVNVSMELYDATSVPSGVTIVGKGQISQQPLFYGYGGAIPTKGRNGGWEVVGGIKVELNLGYVVLIPAEGVTDARLILHDTYGNSWGKALSVQDGNIVFYSDDANPNAEIVISQVLPSPCDPNQMWGTTRAFSLGTGLEVPISYDMVQIILQSSQDIVETENSMKITASIWSYYGSYGNVPLLVATYDADAKDVVLQVGTSDLRYLATGFSLINQVTGAKIEVTVPAGARTVKTDIPKGAYHIITRIPIPLNGAKG